MSADRAFRWLCLTEAALVVFGYVQFHAALPVLLSGPGGLTPTQIAVVFGTNTFVVALAAVAGARLAAIQRPAAR